MCIGTRWRIQDFPEGGANSQSGCADLFFGHENERIWTPSGEGGGMRPWRPLDPPLEHVVYYCRMFHNIPL